MENNKYFNITKFIKDNMSHTVEPFQFKRLLAGLGAISLEKDTNIHKHTGEGKNKKTIVRIEFMPLFANWLLRKKDKYVGDGDFDLIVFNLVFNVEELNEYIE